VSDGIGKSMNPKDEKKLLDVCADSRSLTLAGCGGRSQHRYTLFGIAAVPVDAS